MLAFGVMLFLDMLPRGQRARVAEDAGAQSVTNWATAVMIGEKRAIAPGRR